MRAKQQKPYHIRRDIRQISHDVINYRSIPEEAGRAKSGMAIVLPALVKDKWRTYSEHLRLICCKLAIKCKAKTIKFRLFESKTRKEHMTNISLQPITNCYLFFLSWPAADYKTRHTRFPEISSIVFAV